MLGVLLCSRGLAHTQPQFNDLGQLTPLAAEDMPRFGTFWVQDSNGNLLPWPCLPEDAAFASFFALPNGQFYIDASEPTTMVLTSTTAIPLPGDGGEGGGPAPDPPPNIPNSEKFSHQAFSLIYTNDAALSDTNLYATCISFPADTNAGSCLQLAKHGNDAVVIKANHFNYSGETDRDFALVVCDKMETPLWRSVDLSSSSNFQNGWIIQGNVRRQDVTDPMFLLVTNLSHVYNAFFRAVPYGGPRLQVTGAEAYATVSNVITLNLSVADLSGITKHELFLTVNGLPATYSLQPTNTLSIDTSYSPNGYATIYATVVTTNALLQNPENQPMDTKIAFTGTESLPLDFENNTFLYFAGDMSDPNIGTNYTIFGVAPPNYFSSTITEPGSGRTLKTFSGYNPSCAYVELGWTFTEADGVTLYTNDNYVVSFKSSPNPIGGNDPQAGGPVTTITITNSVGRAGVRAARWSISSYEEVEPGSLHGNGAWINSEMARWGGATEFMLESLYSWNFGSQTQYFPWQIGSGRNNPPISPPIPYVLNPTTELAWATWLQTMVTNRNFSDFNYGPGHGNGFLLGGGEFCWSWMNYVNTTISANTIGSWVQTGAKEDRNYRMRKVALWACGTAWISQGYGTWPNAFGIRPPAQSANSLGMKNVGLFFNDKLEAYPYGVSSGFPTDLSEVVATFDKIWVMGANPYPGGADPNYSAQFALNVTLGLFPELRTAVPLLLGCPYLPYAGVYDDALMRGDASQVKQ